MLSKEAIKAKKKFQNLGTLINLLSLNPKKLSKPKIISHASGFGTYRINSGHAAENSGGYATKVISRMILEERAP